jgi:hypothetical protein
MFEQKVKVKWKEKDGKDEVVLMNAISDENKSTKKQ